MKNARGETRVALDARAEVKTELGCPEGKTRQNGRAAERSC